MLKAAKAYLSTQVTTTTQGEVLLLLYEAAIKNLRQAQERIAERDYAAKGILISKALDIISELSASLNVEKGGDLARNLHSLYFYCSSRLLKANLKMDVTVIDEVIRILDGIRSAFAEIIPGQEGRSSKTLSAPATRPVPTAPSGAPQPGGQAVAPMAAAPLAVAGFAAPTVNVPSAPEGLPAPAAPGPRVSPLVNPLARRAQNAYAAPRNL